MNYVAIQNINYHEDFRLVLGEGQCKWEYGLVIRGRKKYIQEASDTFLVAVVAIIYGKPDTQVGSRMFKEKSRVIKMSGVGQKQN